jgi:branched-chain amino acid transport system substrate-binding protein
VNGLAAALSPNTVLALLTALRQQGVGLKAALLFSYGADLTQGGAATMQAAQGAYTVLSYEPMEMHTAATERFAKALRSVGVSGDPSPSEYNGYVDVGLLVRGLQDAGPSPTHASLINGLASVHNFDAVGLWGGNLTINLASRAPTAFGGPGNCGWVTKVVGSGFQLVPGAEPICGPFISG